MSKFPLNDNPLHAMARAIEEQAAINFLAKFGKSISVTGKLVQTPGEPPAMTFHMTLDRPGLLPTALERHWFDGFIQGYRCASSVIAWLLDPPADADPN